MIPGVSDDTQHVPDGPDATRKLRPMTGNAGMPRFGRFQTTAELGEGGMGTVYRAHDDVLGRDVAIKVLHAKGELGVRERFVREARAIGAALHPHILAVYDAGDTDGTPYLVMELATGGSLRERTKAGPLPVETVREVGVQIAGALAAAHAARIIHRDVKPANILLAQPGMWKLADFGIARTPDSTLTITGQFLGSPSYAAPESLRAGEFSPASDVYSLGATLYEALAGGPPHGDHDMQSIVRKLESEAPPIHTKREVPSILGDAIMAALSRDPARRPSAAELAARLAQAGTAASVTPLAAAPRMAVGSVPAAQPAQTMAASVAPQPLAGSAPPQPASTRGRNQKLFAAVLAALAIVAIVLAVKNRGEPAQQVPGLTRPVEGAGDTRGGAHPRDGTGERAANPDELAGDGRGLPPGEGWDDEIAPPGAPAPPSAPGAPEAPMVVDQYGNPVDEETARAILEQMERDARSAYDRGGKGRGRWKHKGN